MAQFATVWLVKKNTLVHQQCIWSTDAVTQQTMKDSSVELLKRSPQSCIFTQWPFHVLTSTKLKVLRGTCHSDTMVLDLPSSLYIPQPTTNALPWEHSTPYLMSTTEQHSTITTWLTTRADHSPNRPRMTATSDTARATMLHFQFTACKITALTDPAMQSVQLRVYKASSQKA